MKNLLVYIFVLISLLPQAKTNSEIIGRWEDLEKTEEGLHRRLQFNPDGSFSSTFGVTFKGTYKLQGNRLITDSFQPDSKVVRDRLQISIKGKALFLKVKRAQQMEGIRLSPQVADSPAIVGRWQFEIPSYHDGGSAGFWEVEFSKNGKLTSRFEFHPAKGRYKIEGDSLVTTVGEETEINRFRFEDGFLLVKSPPDVGAEHKFKRIEER